MNKFLVGQTYKAGKEADEIRILKRSEKMVTVTNNYSAEWRMKIHEDQNGDEYLVDTFFPRSERPEHTYRA